APPFRRRVLGSWLACGLSAAITTCTLSAVQLLPTTEAAGEATRSSGMAARNMAAVFWPATQALFGPGWDDGWEARSGLCVLWVASAAVAPMMFRGRIRYEAILSLALLASSLGAAALLQWLPGFRLFQIPTRMALFFAVPVSLFAGQSLELLNSGL